MRRSATLIVTAAAVTLALGVSPAAAQQQAPGRVLIVWSNGVEAADLARVAGSLRDASVALVSTLTAGEGLAASTFGAGRRVEAPPPRATPLRAGLERLGFEVAGVVEAGEPASTAASHAFGGSVRTIEARDVDDLTALPDKVAAFIDIGGDGARLAAALMSSARDTDVVVLVSGAPNADRERRAVRLGVVALSDPGGEAGLLQSPTTRRSGLVSLTDLSPTIVAAAGGDPGTVEGRPAEVRAFPDAVDQVVALERDLVRAHGARGTVTRSVLIAMVLLAVAGAALVRWPRWLAPVGVGLMALPLAGFVSVLFPGDPAIIAIVLAAAVAVISLRIGVRSVAAGVALATVAVPLADLLLGSPVSHRSPWGVLLAGGGRFYGASEDTLGFAAAGSLVAAALLVRSRRSLLLAVSGFAVVVAVLSAPGFGAKFGAAPTLVPAFGVFAVTALGKRFTVKVVASIALATVLATAGSVLADRLLPEDERSHVARALGTGTDLGDLISRKFEANAEVTFFRAWLPASLVAGGALILLTRRRRLAEDLAALAPALVVVSLTTLAANDGGIVGVAPLLAVVLGAGIATGRRSPPAGVEV